EVLVLAPHVAGTAETDKAGQLAVRRFRYGPAWLERIGYRGERPRRLLLDPLAVLALPAYFLRFRSELRRTAERFRPDVIHAHWWFPAGWLVSRLEIPFVVTCHGTDVRLLEVAPFRRMARRVFAAAGAVTTVSRFLADDVARHAGPLPRPIVVAPMPVDVDAFAAGEETPKAEPPRFLYAGNLVAAKGVDILIRALALLVSRGVTCRLRILGEGPAQPRLQALARSLGVADRIDWSAFVPQDHMPAEYGAATVTVLPSRGKAEGLGLILVEALCAGSAVVGTPVGGIPEVILDGRTGLLARGGGGCAHRSARTRRGPGAHRGGSAGEFPLQLHRRPDDPRPGGRACVGCRRARARGPAGPQTRRNQTTRYRRPGGGWIRPQ